MVSLVDIAPATEKVPVAGAQLDVFGVSAKSLASVMARFPEIRMMLTGKFSSLTAESLIALAPNAIAAIIAEGTGHGGDIEQEEAAGRLYLEDQVTLLEAILRLTLPNGFQAFVGKLQAMGLLDGPSAPSGGVPVTKSQKPSKA